MQGDPIRPGLEAAIASSRREVARPGAWWTGAERVAMAETARAVLVGREPAVDHAELLAGAVDSIRRIAGEPAQTTKEWVEDQVAALGEQRYVELVGVVARTVAVDTFDLLRGVEPPPLPEPVPGDPTGEPMPAAARRNRTWVAMVTPSPPAVLGAVPSAESAMNALSDELYMPEREMADPASSRGALSRPQTELVATATSLANECFY